MPSCGDFVDYEGRPGKEGQTALPPGVYEITMVEGINAYIQELGSLIGGYVARNKLKKVPRSIGVTPMSQIERAPTQSDGQRIFGDLFDPEDLDRPADVTTDAIAMRFHNKGGNLPTWVIADMTTLIERVNQLERES